MAQEDLPVETELKSLVEVIDDARCHDREVLNACVSKGIRPYIEVPSGHVAVVCHHAVLEKRKVPFAVVKPALVYPGVAIDDRAIKYVQIHALDLLAIRDGGSATVDGFFHGGLCHGPKGLVSAPFEYCAIRRDTLDPFSSTGRTQGQLPGRIKSVPLKLTIDQLLLSQEDADVVRRSVIAVEDRWGHEKPAPGVFLAYRAAHMNYEFERIKAWLVNEDKNDIYIAAVAGTISSLMKIGVKRVVLNGFKLEKITNNEMRQSYADRKLSERMSLIMLATDCWIHDEAIRLQLERSLAPKRKKALEAGLDPYLELEKRNEISAEFVNFERMSRDAIKLQMHMPDGLESYLNDLGFSSNQAEHIVRVITSVKGSRHGETKKNADIALKKNSARRK